jgi:hypothetical protein
MRGSVVATIVSVSVASSALASDGTTTSPSLRQIVDEVATKGSALVHNGNSTIRLVHDQSQCGPGERLAPIWINFFDVRQHLSGYTCQADIE